MPDQRVHRDRAIAEIGSSQHGVVSAHQLYKLGFSKHQLSERVAAGRLHRLYRGVYAVGHKRSTQHGRWMAAVLACGDGAVLSHGSAARLWGILDRGGSPIEVSTPSRGGRGRRPGLVVHRRPTLRMTETTRRDGIPVTIPALTILDLAASFERRPLERLIDAAERLRLCNGDDLAAIVAAHGGRAGAGALGTLLTGHAIGSTVTRSELEERFLALCRERGLPDPLVNQRLLDYEVDFHWPAARVVVELDGHASHGTRAAFERDRDRDTHLAAHGYQTLRFTWRDVTARPAVVAHRVRRVVGS